MFEVLAQVRQKAQPDSPKSVVFVDRRHNRQVVTIAHLACYPASLHALDAGSTGGVALSRLLRMSFLTCLGAMCCNCSAPVEARASPLGAFLDAGQSGRDKSISNLGSTLRCFFPRSHFESSPNGVVGNSIQGVLTSENQHLGPSGGLVWRTKRGMAAVGVYTTLSAAIDYPHPRNLIAIAVGTGQDRRLDYLHEQAVFAYARPVTEHWALGAGLRLSVSNVRTDSYTPALRATEGAFHWDHAPGLGAVLGARWKGERTAFALTYLSRQWSREFDAYQDLLPHSVDLPHTLQAGLAWRLTPRLDFTLDAHYAWWKEVRFFGNGPLDSGLGWENQYGFKAGLSYALTPIVALRAGFSHLESPAGKEQVFINTLTPAFIENLVGFGFSVRASARTELHAAALFALPRRIEDSGEGGLFSALGRGSEVRVRGQCFALGITRYF